MGGRIQLPTLLDHRPRGGGQDDFLIQGTITRVQCGDLWERRCFEAFGLGATEVRAIGVAVDLAGARSVSAFSLTMQSSYPWLDNEAGVRENLREIAQEIAAILIQAK